MNLNFGAMFYNICLIWTVARMVRCDAKEESITRYHAKEESIMVRCYFTVMRV
jgi:hypothetical protein